MAMPTLLQAPDDVEVAQGPAIATETSSERSKTALLAMVSWDNPSGIKNIALSPELRRVILQIDRNNLSLKLT
jgi:hypothetical protein